MKHQQPKIIHLPRGYSDTVPTAATHIIITMTFKQPPSDPAIDNILVFSIDFQPTNITTQDNTVVVVIHPTKDWSLQCIFASLHVKRNPLLKTVRIQAVGYAEICDLVVRTRKLPKRKYSLYAKLESSIFKINAPVATLQL